MPSRRRPRKVPVGFFSTHKARSVWFQQSSAFPRRDADPCEVERRMFVDPASPPQQWEPVGPTNFAGRVTALAIHPRTGMLYAGCAAGGIWRSPDLGKTWLPPSLRLFPPLGNTDPRYANISGWPTNNIGALAIDPQNPDHILCATGEANGSADAYPGCGIFHSLDAGETWHVLAFTQDTGLSRRIGALAVDPADPRRIYAGGTTHAETEAAGLFRSTDGGISWGVENFCNKSYFCHSMAFSAGQRMLISVDMRGASNGIWRAEDRSNAFWIRVAAAETDSNLPDGLLFGRASLASAPSNPAVIYAMAGDRRGRVLAILRSDNAGDGWIDVAGTHFSGEHQSSYTNCIAVHPTKPNFVVCGGNHLHLTTNGGKTWQQIGNSSALPGAPDELHSDHHAILILDDGTIVAGTDGGVYISHNRGRTWHSRLRGMQTTMFYAFDVAPTDPNCIGGGCQDVGTVVRDGRDRPGRFRNVISGDGAWLVYDPEDAEVIFGGYHEAHIFRHRKAGDLWVNVNPPIPEAERKRRAIVVMAIDPVRRKGRPHKYVYLGTDRLWRTANFGKSWRPVSPVFDATAISAIAIAPHNPNMVVIGTARGGIFRTLDGAKTWSESFAGAEIPKRLISSIEIFQMPESPEHPRDSELSTRMICTVAGTGEGKLPVPRLFRRQQGDELLAQGYSHVFACLGVGAFGWKDADGGKLPDMAYQASAFETNPPFRVFVAGDFGVFMSLPGGFEALEKSFNLTNVTIAEKFHWVNITGNLPNVIVSDLVYHREERALYASTYGRGIWRIRQSEEQWQRLGSDMPEVNPRLGSETR